MPLRPAPTRSGPWSQLAPWIASSASATGPCCYSHYVLATRRSELVALDVEDLVLVDQGLVAVVWRRKTDQERSDLDLVAVPYMQEPV